MTSTRSSFRARRRGLRVSAALVACIGASSLLTACQSNDADYRLIQSDLTRTAGAPKQFVWVRQTLAGTHSVSGIYQDPYRYDVLYSQGDQSAWEEVVKDDAVADRFLDANAVVSFFQSGGQQGQPPTSPSGATAALTGQGTPNTAVAALLARHWVLDPGGAPQLPSVGQELQAEKTDPFYASLIFLTDIGKLVEAAPSPQVRRWHKDDVQPVYKPAYDPFPPPGPGVERYDVFQQPLPVLTSNSPGATPAPPTLSNLVKIAIYVKGSYVVQIREVVDPIDHLQDLVNNYHLSLPKHLSRQGEEQFAQQVLDRLSRGQTGPPITIGQTIWQATGIGSPQQVSLPTDFVQANLSVLPGRGSKASST
ncbi:MAG TPA: hypothetical protein VE990_17445 [Acidimicrobiales bacterium]|nr:hypothetical protein [Acidimicrobiales bacterium]